MKFLKKFKTRRQQSCYKHDHYSFDILDLTSRNETKSFLYFDGWLVEIVPIFLTSCRQKLTHLFSHNHQTYQDILQSRKNKIYYPWMGLYFNFSLDAFFKNFQNIVNFIASLSNSKSNSETMIIVLSTLNLVYVTLKKFKIWKVMKKTAADRHGLKS